MMIRIRKGHLTKARCVRSNRWNKSGHKSHLFSSLIPSINHSLPFQLFDFFNGPSRKHNLNMPQILLLHYCPYLFSILASSLPSSMSVSFSLSLSLSLSSPLSSSLSASLSPSFPSSKSKQDEKLHQSCFSSKIPQLCFVHAAALKVFA